MTCFYISSFLLHILSFMWMYLLPITKVSQISQSSIECFLACLIRRQLLLFLLLGKCESHRQNQFAQTVQSVRENYFYIELSLIVVFLKSLVISQYLDLASHDIFHYQYMIENQLDEQAKYIW